MKPTKSAHHSSLHHDSEVTGFRMLYSRRKYRIPLDRLDHESLTLGRTNGCDLRIRHPTVSRDHCTLDRASDGGILIKDTKSKNGLEVAERGRRDKIRKVSWWRLELGDFVRVGDVTLVAVDTNDECPIAVKTAKELALRAVAIYGSETEACKRLEITRETLHILLEGKSR